MRSHLVALAVCATLPAQTASARQTPAVPAAPVPSRTGPTASQFPLPRLTNDAAFLVEQWKGMQAGIIERLRYLQLTYRDSGHAEDAAAVAAEVRQLQRPSSPATNAVTAALVNEGLPPSNDPIYIGRFNQAVGQVLSFAIRGRTDQPVFGTTTYAEISGLETAAVHAGLLKEGQQGIMRVQILPGQDLYEASARNGVESARSGRASGSFRFMQVNVTVPNRTAQLSSYRDLVGQSITIPVVGTTAGQVWGSDIYSDDSALSAAVVHRGVLRADELGWVRVTFVPGQPRYFGSLRNGVTSQDYDAFDGSFSVEVASPPPAVQLPGGEDASALIPMETLRGREGFAFVVQVVGATGRNVWGSGTYTDDSSIAAAAVHAGLLKPGELGFVRVSIAPGRESYAGTDSNGIKSLDYGPWQGSFRLERVNAPR